MGEQHYEGAEPVEARSKIKLTRNAKGDVQWELSVIEGATEAELDRLRQIAVAQYRALLDEFKVRAAA